MDSFSFLFSCLFLIILSSSNYPTRSDAQQTYINNKQSDCYNPQVSNITNGFLCNKTDQRSCISYLTFRAQPPYDSPTDIGYLLGSNPLEIAKLNNITDIEKIPFNTIVIVPVNCSCSSITTRKNSYYQHNSSYTLKSSTETYFSVANNTYQGLSTCQAMMSQNPNHESRKLLPGMELVVPLRCACTSTKQISSGFKFLISYMVKWRDDIPTIAKTWSGVGANEQSIFEANKLSPGENIYPFTTILVPVKAEPKIIQGGGGGGGSISPPPSGTGGVPPTQTPLEPSKSSKKWVGLGIGIGIGVLLVIVLCGFLVWFLCYRRRGSNDSNDHQGKTREKANQEVLIKKAGVVHTSDSSSDYITKKEIHNENKYSSVSVTPDNARYAMDSLILYKFEELQKASGYFAEENRIKGTVFRGLINGDNAAIKRMKGDVSSEINILKQINHSNVIKLSGFCLHEGNTYLVYEFAENGSLSDWLHSHDQSKKYPSLGWNQRVKIAYEIADGLNYLHNDANPPYIHKDLKSSNILLDSNLKAKIANFGVARSLIVDNLQDQYQDQGLEEEEDGGQGEKMHMQMTRHVVGTQGYMAPEYLENGVITTKLDVFAFGVVILELLSGREAVSKSVSNDVDGRTRKEVLLCDSIKILLQGENVRERLTEFIDPSLGKEYPLELVFSMAQLAMECVSSDLNRRPNMLHVFMSMSKILSSSLDWDPSV